MIQQPSEFETMRVLHSLFIKELLTWEQVEELLIASTGLELTYLNKVKFEAESLDGSSKYKLGLNDEH
jgi:hypothetical protein